jgi:isoleucyl-tRNA synthetase
MRISKDIFKQLSDIYLKIRNTARFILGNLSGFDPDSPVAFENMTELDRWALMRLNKLIEKVRADYEAFEFHSIYHGIHNFCVVDMSNFYLDIIKDRLYCEGRVSLERRSAQTAMYLVLDAIVRMISPILAFTAEEIWQFMPHHKGADAYSVMFNSMPEPDARFTFTSEQEAKWEKLRALRLDVNKALELARAEKIIGKSLEADVTLYLNERAAASFRELSSLDLKSLFIVSGVNVRQGTGTGYKGENFAGATIQVSPSGFEKCSRCWIHDEHIGKDAEHSELCPRCADVVKSM